MDDITKITIRTIKNYVRSCVAPISLQNLIEEFHMSFNQDIPYTKFGYSSVVDLLTNIPGISVKYENGKYYVLSQVKRKSKNKVPDSIPDDVSSLCVVMKNNLVLQCRDQKRTVTVQPEKLAYTRKNPVLRRYSSFSSKTEESKSANVNSTPYPRTPSYSSVNSADFESDVLDLSSLCGDTSFEYDSSVPTESYSDFDFSDNFVNGNYAETAYCYSEPVFDNWIPRACPITPKSELSNYELLSRVRGIINSQTNFLTSMDVELRYYENYSEMLPDRWLATLEKSSSVYIENLSSDVIIYPNRLFDSTPTLAALPLIKYPAHLPWNIHVTAASSTTSIWFRFRENEYETKYEILSNELRKHYANENPESLNFMASEELYVARLESHFVRVTVIFCKEGLATCLDIDSGIMHRLYPRNLYVLHEKFTNIPALAVHSSLTDLERYDKCSYISCRLLTMVLDKNATAAVDFVGKDGKISLNLFVQNSVHNINVNDAIKKMVEEKFMPPKLELNQMYDVNVLTLNESDARVQILSPCMTLLLDSLQKSKEIIDKFKNKDELFAKSMLDVQLSKEVYLAKYKDGSWQRITAKEFTSTTRAVVLFIDLGEAMAMDIVNIVTCSNFPDTLTYIPPQAVNVRIVKTDHMVLRYMYEKYKTKLFSIKIVEKEPELLVQMFLKLPNNETSKPINNVHLLNTLHSGFNFFQTA